MQQDGPVASAGETVPRDGQGVGTPAPVGERLRQAREARGLARDEFARRAHIPLAVLSDLEDGRLERLGAAVFVRGYLRSAARAAGLPDGTFLDALPATGSDAPPLVAQRIGPSTPRWVTRYATPVAYALLTAVVMVPLVYLARPTPQQVAQPPSLTPIDAATRAGAIGLSESPAARELASSPAPAAATPRPEPAFVGPPAPERVVEPPPSPAPVMASLAPLPQSGATLAARRVTLKLDAASWVEFTANDGRRLEYALLPAGTVREYQLTGSAELRIGNASEAALTVDGRAVDLLPFSSPNDVARVQLGEAREHGAD